MGRYYQQGGAMVTTFVIALAGIFLTLGAVEQVGAMSLFGHHHHEQNGGTSGNSTQSSQSLGTGLSSQAPLTSVPEPSTVMLLASGLLGLGLWRFRRKR